MKILLCLLLIIINTNALWGQEVTKPSPTIQLTNGYWFDGTTFKQRTVWVYDGKLSFAPMDSPVDTVINLDSQYVIPPFGEAHNHNLESEYGLEKRIQNYLDHGVFYVKCLSAIKKQLEPLMHHYNHAHGLDISTTYAPLTGTGGHPVALRERFFDWGYFDDLFANKNDIETHGYFIIDSEAELEEKWPHILSFGPQFIKINLLHSEEYHQRKNDTTYFGNKGLNPELVTKIVQKAHQAGLRVSAHVETAHDFHIAVKAEVDEIAHLPEIDHGQLIKWEDALEAARKGTVLVPTASLIKKRSDRPEYQDLVSNMKKNLELLQKAGVKMAIGSDNFNGNSVGEFELLRSFGIFSNLELLKMWVEESAFTIFPDRRVGRLAPEYEANFLILSENPLENMEGITEKIVLKVKQGYILD